MSPDLPPHIRRRVLTRSRRLRSLGFASYGEYLASGTWQAVKARYRASDRTQKCMCGATEGLQIHHTTYERVGGDERNEDLMPLCPTCHTIVHVLERRRDIGLEMEGLYDAERAEEWREYLADVERQRELKREAFHQLPLHERVRRLEAAGCSHRHMFVIKKTIEKAEAKFEGLVTPANTPRLDRQVREAEAIMTRRRPEVLTDQLADDIGNPVPYVASQSPPHDCGGYRCSHVLCKAEVEQRVQDLTRRPTRTSQPWVPRPAA